MSLENILIWLLMGAIAGWLAGVLVKGYGFGLFGNIIVGIIGSSFGGWLFPRLGISAGSGMIDSIIGATIGAAIILLLLRLVKSA